MKINQIVKIFFVLFLFNFFSMANANEIQGLANVKFGQNINDYINKRPTAGKGVYELDGNDIAGYDYMEVSTYGYFIFEITAIIRHSSITEAKNEAIEIRKQLEKKYHYKFYERSSSLSTILQSFVTNSPSSKDVEITINVIDKMGNEPVSIFLTLESDKARKKASNAYDTNQKINKTERLKNL